MYKKEPGTECSKKSCLFRESVGDSLIDLDSIYQYSKCFYN